MLLLPAHKVHRHCAALARLAAQLRRFEATLKAESGTLARALLIERLQQGGRLIAYRGVGGETAS